ncbi:MAG: sel1 repeat family protein [Lachnospiraceae bacterium]|nr:sel1 repeat family protein [Lachnospiraceae bacterium]
MTDLKVGSYVRVIETGRYGIVKSIGRKVTVDFYRPGFCYYGTDSFSKTKLVVVESPRLKTSQLRALVRGEIDADSLTNGTGLFPSGVQKDAEAYRIKASDMLAGIETFADRDLGECLPDVLDWAGALLWLDEEIELPSMPECRNGISEADILACTYAYLCDIVQMTEIAENPAEGVGEALDAIREILKVWLDSNGQEYPEILCRQVVDQFDGDSVERQPEGIQQLFKHCLDKLCELKDPAAIQKRGYCYYGGTKLYPCDWVKARDAFLEYYGMTGDPTAANTLGYIYYYGRCNGGVPQYDEAFRYFSIGHAFTIYESTYKLADMFAHGYGVVRNDETAARLYISVYENNRGMFMDGNYECKFADAALRIGNCFRYGLGVRQSLETAYYYYLQADLAIRLRAKAGSHYGDTTVYRGIQKAMEDVRREYTERSRTECFIGPVWANWAVSDHRCGKVAITRLKDGALSIHFSLLRVHGDEETPRMLITIPRADYCEFHKKITIRTERDSSFRTADGADEFVYDDVTYNHETHLARFYLLDHCVAEISAEKYMITVPAPARTQPEGDVYHIVSVAFDESGKLYDYLCDDDSVQVGDLVLVPGYDGEQEVKVVAVAAKYESELAFPIDRYKKIIRKA